ncbi:hypothetical protein SeMB42_g03979 [Synchytrium endobioticum]|uniref:non-specific serine/threonine protein kinase n=1 Tax=Synchytrium endobioticum TaxID=286115 RepID=A0A507D1W3_9FUNG|nr:hypothetical protein SeMB42_g03979 [Synchytrium endobioticum]
MSACSTPSDNTDSSPAPPVATKRRVLTYGKRTQSRFIIKPPSKEWNVSPVESSRAASSIFPIDLDDNDNSTASASPLMTFPKYTRPIEKKKPKPTENPHNESGKLRKHGARPPGKENQASPLPFSRKATLQGCERKPLGSVSSNAINSRTQSSKSPVRPPLRTLATPPPTTKSCNSSVSQPTNTLTLQSVPTTPFKVPQLKACPSRPHDAGVAENPKDSPLTTVRRGVQRIALSSPHTSSSPQSLGVHNVKTPSTGYGRLSIQHDSTTPDHSSTPLSASLPSPILTPPQTPLQELLDMCGQTSPITFESFLSKSAIQTARKLGEATFSEVYCISHPNSPNEPAAVKILPFDGRVPVNGCIQQTAHAVLQEFRITRIMGDLQNVTGAAFVPVVKLGIIRDLYPQGLLDEWDRWDKEHESESDRPDYLPPDQLYAILVLEHAGTDLEHSKLRTWKQARSLLGQAVASFSIAEREAEFEHRDLHWGNFMLKPTKEAIVTYRLPSESIVIKTLNLRATIIDYTLSRVHCRQRKVTCFLALDDEDYFNGEGDYQFDCYRIMRQETNRDWAGYYPRTNVEFTDFVDRILKYRTCDEMMRKDAYLRDTLTIKVDRSVDDTLAEAVNNARI